MGAGAAARVAGAVGAFLDGPVPVRIRAWDGSEAGAAPGPGVPTVVLRSRRALRRLLWEPGEMGLAHAYVSGDLDVDGDLAEGLSAMWSLVNSGTITKRRPGATELLGLAAQAVRLGLLGTKPAPPPEAIKIKGRLHSRRRDRDVIAHHYDAGNAFYSLLLDASMAYSSGYWTSEDSTLARAQHDKLELICRKLDLAPGRRLLDIGCGWGSLAVHAAREHGAQVRAVTISREQRDHVNARIRAEGLAGQVQVDLLDYRDVAEKITAVDGPFDAVSAIEMGEHVGDEHYPTFAAILHGALRPGGRALVQQMSRGANAPGGGAFIETYVTPDMVMRPVGDTLTFLQHAGLEVRDVHVMREHYVPTIRAWLATLEERFDEAVSLVGERGARMWRLYLAGGALAFEENRMGVDQILLARPTDRGRSGMPATRDDWAVRSRTEAGKPGT
ncbi:cyclopropane-fatty-acyl-phospholipid synthase [Actinomycetospora succinea]|uniref:Cyclopropane-fatty-acyl-phospholipid synthase n=1 Tax=Actinomycetospora succinea TaxID=663603 RepID=A0A4R6VTG8_9PSEU|nr:cyclopropane-fatty-acyl-phospholipid synthase family protein [Actinomycetospora succinea]TDQ65830.1 cyclopropane-fatty-acyl-phospholipid synthase [Actinomycetospora succinea]